MKYDIIVIGSGPGGYVAAIRAAQLGRKVAVVEREQVGGTCLNWGCIPTKALLKSADAYRYALHAAEYGVSVEGEVRPDFGRMIARSRAVAEQMSKGVLFLLKKNGVELIAGTASLEGAGRVRIEGGEVLEADHIILATGARPRRLEAIPVDGERIITSREALALERLPASMIVVGSGAIGSEMACLFATLGVKVSIVEYLPNLMPLEDEEVSKAVERAFRKMRMGVYTSTAVKAARTTPEGCEVEIAGKRGSETLVAETVLSAVGVQPNTEGLGLEAAGVALERGKVAVDQFYRTTASGIYAIGDLVPGPALAHVASAEAICCVERICGLDPRPVAYDRVPSCVYTSPQVASVGLTERQAAERGIEVRIGRFPFTASGKATAASAREGFVKLIFDAASDRLIGAHMVGADVTEMIAEPTLAAAMGATAHDLARTIHPHPTMSEAVMEAAEQATGAAIHL